ncbi:hypothetical protein CHCC5024_0949 [Bacillus licheniformis]|nr:hypothetical protein CHCC5024_0949 [Bacillus licheniformis]
MKEEKIFRQIHVPRFVKSHFKSKNRENQKKNREKARHTTIIGKILFKKRE